MPSRGSLEKLPGTIGERSKAPHSLVTLEIDKPAREITDEDARAHCPHGPGLETAPGDRGPSRAGRPGGRRGARAPASGGGTLTVRGAACLHEGGQTQLERVGAGPRCC